MAPPALDLERVNNMSAKPNFNKHTFALHLITTQPDADMSVIVEQLLEGHSKGLHTGTAFTPDQARAYYTGCCRELGWEPKGVPVKVRAKAVASPVSREEAASAISAGEFVESLGSEERLSEDA